MPFGRVSVHNVVFPTEVIRYLLLALPLWPLFYGESPDGTVFWWVLSLVLPDRSVVTGRMWGKETPSAICDDAILVAHAQIRHDLYDYFYF